MDRVVALLRYPVKSARAEHLQSARLGPDGLDGDREWACIDDADGTVGSVKHPRRWGRLLAVGASEDTIHLDGRSFAAGTPEADAALSRYLGRAVRLTREVPADARLHRLLPEQGAMVPDWMDGPPGTELVTGIAGAHPGGRFVDFGAVHIVRSADLAALAARLGRAEVAAERFRPNLVIDTEPDLAPGTELQIGAVRLRVSVPTPRCVVPGLEHHEAPADRAVLHALGRHYRTDVAGYGRAACFGVYADVIVPGAIRVGDSVNPLS